ncbi:DUF4271 domain-containing protein [uncultured Draconibacterium sp.]|uniref:DUF4271 domain-containing protein n=1 Tax=uncultured Draconibacterium sp. TaxID=1573823 RepID=UPI0029C915A0|nr:DUF4271 domain-containing protein [uncultured Draconibacterium sp.]
MGVKNTYYQDTTKALNQRVEVPQNVEETSNSVQIKGPQTSRKNFSVVDSSDYIAPRTETKLHTELLEKPTFILPNRERNKPHNDWITIIIFVAIAIIASIRYTYAKYIQQLFLSLFNYATSVRMLNDKNYPVFHAAFRLEIIFYITLPLFIFQCLNLFKYENTAFAPQYFLIIFGSVLLYFFGKKLIYLTLGLLFETQNETREYLFNFDNFNRSLSLVLLPIVILIQFAPLKSPMFIAILGLVILFILNIILLRRGAIILLKKQFSLFYLFLYLCTLEILPLLLIYKVVV